jgi:tRNA/tmRNA/rRNA uracil-C5-methylase (TrmA/RlmC/RlmD family)
MVRGRAGSPKLGLFQARSHRIADIPECRIHHPLVNRVAQAAREAIRDTSTRPYADAPHRGDLRALQVVVERGSQSAQVVLVGNALRPEPLLPLAEALERALGRDLHSLWWNGNPARTNTILGDRWHRLAGPDAVRESIGGADVFFPPGAFGQSHLELADRLVAQVHAWVPGGARVAEAYAGCGAIGLGLLARSAQVRFNESAPDALRGLALGIAARPHGDRARCEIVAGDAGAAAPALCDADVVVCDPPRKGLAPALLAALRERPPRLLVYVSCDLESFARQSRELRAEGALRLAELVAFAAFPYTERAELAARFTPPQPAGRMNDWYSV